MLNGVTMKGLGVVKIITPVSLLFHRFRAFVIEFGRFWARRLDILHALLHNNIDSYYSAYCICVSFCPKQYWLLYVVFSNTILQYLLCKCVHIRALLLFITET